MRDLLRKHPSLWLLLGAVLTFASQFRFGLGSLAWVAPIPILHYLRSAPRAGARWLTLVALLATWVAITLKIVTAPLGPITAVFFGLPIGLMLTLPYLVWAWLRPRVGDVLGAPAFAAAMVLGELALQVVLPFGTWGSAANTQLDHLGLLQLASVTGLHGVSFLVYVVAASAEARWASEGHTLARPVLAWLGVVLAVSALGELRVATATATATHGVRVATVDTDATFHGWPLPTADETARIDARLFERTREAARAGARLVVWTEASTLVRAEDEGAFRARLAGLARETHAHVVAGYVVPLAPPRYRNEYVMVGPDGRVEQVYAKHRPVPGEPAVAGTGPAPLTVDPVLGRISGAICYDYDYPRLGLERARLGADVVVLPSSDWRGIDPIHTEMARLRAIEGGHGIVRSTRDGLSAVIDPYGRVRAQHSHFDGGAGTLVADTSARGVRTVYAAIGDSFVALLGGYLAALFARVALWYARGAWERRSSRSRRGPSSASASASASTPTPSSPRPA